MKFLSYCFCALVGLEHPWVKALEEFMTHPGTESEKK